MIQILLHCSKHSWCSLSLNMSQASEQAAACTVFFADIIGISGFQFSITIWIHILFRCRNMLVLCWHPRNSRTLGVISQKAKKKVQSPYTKLISVHGLDSFRDRTEKTSQSRNYSTCCFKSISMFPGLGVNIFFCSLLFINLRWLFDYMLWLINRYRTNWIQLNSDLPSVLYNKNVIVMTTSHICKK